MNEAAATPVTIPVEVVEAMREELAEYGSWASRRCSLSAAEDQGKRVPASTWEESDDEARDAYERVVGLLQKALGVEWAALDEAHEAVLEDAMGDHGRSAEAGQWEIVGVMFNPFLGQVEVKASPDGPVLSVVDIDTATMFARILATAAVAVANR